MNAQQLTPDGRRQWEDTRDQLKAELAAGFDEEGWPLSPERKDDLRFDIAECDRVLGESTR